MRHRPSSEACDLTPRELEVLGLLAVGCSNKEVARRLDLSVRTVESHRLNLRRKAGGPRRSSIYRLARELGVLPPDPPGSLSPSEKLREDVGHLLEAAGLDEETHEVVLCAIVEGERRRDGAETGDDTCSPD